MLALSASAYMMMYNLCTLISHLVSPELPDISAYYEQGVRKMFLASSANDTFIKLGVLYNRLYSVMARPIYSYVP